MKTKIIAILLTLALCLTFAACSSGGDTKSQSATQSATELKGSDNLHELYIRDDFSDSVSARFFSTQSDDEEEISAELIAEGDDYKTFKCAADPQKYDRVVIISDGDESIELAFNEFVSGWHISAYGAEPFVYDEEEPDKHDFVTKEFKYDDPFGDDTKNVYIYTPSDYDKNSKEKYSVIYMLDGQNLFDRSATSYGSWGVAESVEAFMSFGGKKTIVVGIDDSTQNRDSELTPDIGGKVTSPDYEDGTGSQFCDFVVGEVMPYVEKNYNVRTDRAHTAICGSSSGGIESFYIGMEHPDKFGFIGALSPAFVLYDDSDWVKYLINKNFSKNAPFVYLYCGNADDLESYLYPGAKAMPDNFKTADGAKSVVGTGLPEENIVFYEYDKGMHNEAYWRAIFPEVLKYFNAVK